jgi:hypothetical protein
MEAKTIIFDISNHGFGHLSQSAPVIDRLCERFAELRAVVRTQHPASVVGEFVSSHIEVLPPPPEATMVAPNAMAVDLDASASAYNRLHADWDALVRRETQRLEDLRPAAVVSNINPLSLAAAQRAGVPCVALCCMNWMDIYEKFFGGSPEADRVIETMRRAYSGAEVFLQPRPHMPMENISRRRSIGPIGRRGENRRGELRARLGCASDEKIALLTLGGLADPSTLELLPRIEGVRWLLRRAIAPDRADVSTIESTGLPLIDLLFSAELVLGKDSYCTVVEAAHAGAGIVLVPREDWPETACLVDWATQRCNFALAPHGFDQPEILAKVVTKVLSGDPSPPVDLRGIDEAAEVIAAVSGLS